MRNPRNTRLALALGIAIMAMALPENAAAQQRHGDVSVDGQVTALDAQAILSAVVGLQLPPSFVLSNGVADCLSGRTTPAAIDAQIVLSFVIGLSTSQFCVGQSFGPGATTITLTLPDTSLLINRKLQVRAILRDDQGTLIARPVTWETSNADLVTVDSARGDTAWVSNHGVAFDASATLTAHADGTLRSMAIRVFRSYFGIVIQPQRGDTLEQLNSTRNFTARGRDSVGTLTDFPSVTWAVGDPTIATVPAGPSNVGVVTALTTGTTFLFAETSAGSGGLKKDSVAITVKLPALSVCTGTGGTLHSNQTYTTPQTWSPATNPHYIAGTLNFNTGSSLTVQPGTLVCASSGAFMVFHAGSKLTANGTVTDPIVFKPTTDTDFWSGIQLGDFLGVGPTTDTSSIRNATFERVSASSGAIHARERHVVTLDSVRIRASNVHALTLQSPGSGMIRGVIDTILNQSVFNFAVTLGRGSLEESTIRLGGIASGVSIQEAATLRDVTIDGGTTAILNNTIADSARINDVTISGTSGIALDLIGGLLHPASGNVQITTGSGGGFRGQIGNFATLFPTAVSQDGLKGLGKDTVFITGGSAFDITLEARPDLPWLMSTNVVFDAGSRLVPQPGSRFAFASGSFAFRNGGTLNAVGTPTSFIQFGPANAGSTFGGLSFETPPANPNPALNPIVSSTLTYVRVDSASGVSAGSCCAAIGGADRHKLLMDSVIVRASWNGAVYLNEEGSELKRSFIDLTGNVGSNFTTSFDAVQLGNSVLMENTLVRQTGNTLASGAAAVNAFGTGAVLRGVVIRGSQGRALQAETGIIAASPGGVKTDSANAFPFRGRIENLAALAPTGALQNSSFLGSLTPNGDDRLEITGGTLTGGGALFTMEATPQLRWHMTTSVVFDALTQLVPRPGSRFTFASGAFHFRNGGILTAAGTAAQRIRFEPTITAGAFTGTFNGLAFETPPANPNPALNPIVTSTLSYVRLDSASGVSAGSCCSAIGGADRHKVLMDSVTVRASWNGAVYLNEEGSELKNSFVDLTGNIASAFTTSFDAVQLGNGVTMENTLVRQTGNTLASGAAAVNAFGTGVVLRSVTIRGSQGRALQAENGIIATSLGGAKTDSANAFPFRGRIENLAALAPDAARQITSFIGSVAPNGDNRLEITGGTLTGSGSVMTVEATPQLRWQMSTSVVFDALTQLVPQPGSHFTFVNGTFHFRNGGILTAVGTPTQFIRFQPTTTGNTFTGTFNGLAFETPPANPNPTLSPIATSTLTYVRLDSASGVSAGSCCSAIGAADRHKVLMDSVIVRASWNGAVYLNEEGSELKRSFIDLTGNIGSNFTTGFDAVQLGNNVLMENTLVRQTGNTLASGSSAVNAFGSGITLRGVVIRGSLGRALQAENGIIAASVGGVRTDSANAYPFRGRLENLAALAPSGSQQNASFLGSLAPNLDNRLEITGGSLASGAPLTVEATPQLRWQLSGNPAFDAQTTFAPQAGSNITFVSSGMIFRNGGILNAAGVQGQRITFRPATVSGASFSGLEFDSPAAGDPAVTSTVRYVTIDSATGMSAGGGTCCAALSAGNRHALVIDSLVANRSINGAVYLFAPGSSLANSLVQITGGGAATTTGFTAVILGSSTSATNTTIRRSGGPGLDLQGTSITLTGTRIVSTAGSAGVQVQNPSSGAFAGFVVDSSAGAGVSVQAANVQLSGFVVDHSTGVGVSVAQSNISFTGCDVLRGATHGFALTSSFSGIQIHDCNIGGDLTLNEQNLGQGVFNPATNTNVVDALDNWWGLDVTGANLIPTLGAVNGFSGLVNVLPQRLSKRVP